MSASADTTQPLITLESPTPVPFNGNGLIKMTDGGGSRRVSDDQPHMQSSAAHGQSTVSTNHASTTNATSNLNNEAEGEDDREVAAQVGMRREWNFALLFHHEMARLSLQVSPYWHVEFIDPERFGPSMHHLDRDVRHCPLSPVFRYTDLTAVLSGAAAANGTSSGNANSNNNNANGSGVVGGKDSIGGTEDGDRDALGDSGTTKEELWLEKSKHVEVLYSHIPPHFQLVSFCTVCVQHVLKNPEVVSVDGDTNLAHLTVQNKMKTSHRLGGQRCFSFYYQLHNKSQLMHDVVYAMGTIVNQRGYLILARCAERDELDGYVHHVLVPYYSSNYRLVLDTEVQYNKVSSPLLAAQQERYGELLYHDRSAAVSFSLPMYAMYIRPDYSAIKTVGVGSIACMTLELSVYDRLIEDSAVAEITGMPTHKVSRVLLSLEVEEVARMKYPNVMSTEQYSELKMRRVLGVFADAKQIGAPTTIQLGRRTGCGRLVTFMYEPFQGVVKAMLVSTLVGNFGVTALYLTSLGGGAFDTHLYLHTHLLESVAYHQQGGQQKQFSRLEVVNVRLTDQDLPRAYAGAPDKNSETMTRHVAMLQLCNDGKAEGAVEVLLPPEEGGALPQAAVEATTSGRAPTASPRESMAVTPETMPSPDGSEMEERRNFPSTPEAAVLEGSTHSDSVISITSISRLQGAPSDEEQEEVESPFARDEDMDSISSSTSHGSPCLPEHSSASRSSRQRTRFSAVSFSGNNSPYDGNSRRTSQQQAEVAAGGSSGSSNVFTATEVVEQAAAAVAAAAAQAEQSRRDEVERVLRDEAAGLYYGPSVRDMYMRCCDVQHCRPNSFLLSKLPTDGRFTGQIEEMDLSGSYLGHPGLLAVLRLLQQLPSVRRVYLNDMSLDNVDAQHVCTMLEAHPTIETLHCRGNSGITLPATKYFTRLVRVNTQLRDLDLTGTKMGELVVQRLMNDARGHGGGQHPDPLVARYT